MADKTAMSFEQSQDICANKNNKGDNCEGPLIFPEPNAEKISSRLCVSTGDLSLYLQHSSSVHSEIDGDSERSLSLLNCSTDSGISDSFEAPTLELKDKNKIKIKNDIFEVGSVKKIVAQWEKRGDIIKIQPSLNQVNLSKTSSHNVSARKSLSETNGPLKKTLEERERVEVIKKEKERMKRKNEEKQKSIEKELPQLKVDLQRVKEILMRAHIENEEPLREEENNELTNENDNKMEKETITEIVQEIKIDEKKENCDERKKTKTSIFSRFKSNNIIRRLMKSFKRKVRKEKLAK